MMFEKYTDKHKDKFYLVFRVLIGLLFLQHGLQKLFGIFTDKPPVEIAINNLMFWAGVIETFGSILIILGLFTIFVAIINSFTMLYAYFSVHAPQGLIPIVNKGELALLYFAAFFLLISIGPGKYSLDYLLFKK